MAKNGGSCKQRGRRRTRGGPISIPEGEEEREKKKAAARFSEPQQQRPKTVAITGANRRKEGGAAHA